MKLKIYAIKDRATDQYGNPILLIAAGQATRSFIDETNRVDKDNQIYQHPEDFELYELGEYDTNTGKFETDTPKLIMRAQDVKIRES